MPSNLLEKAMISMVNQSHITLKYISFIHRWLAFPHPFWNSEGLCSYRAYIFLRLWELHELGAYNFLYFQKVYNLLTDNTCYQHFWIAICHTDIWLSEVICFNKIYNCVFSSVAAKYRNSGMQHYQNPTSYFTSNFHPKLLTSLDNG